MTRELGSLVGGTGLTGADILFVMPFPNEADDAAGVMLEGALGRKQQTLFHFAGLNNLVVRTEALYPYRPQEEGVKVTPKQLKDSVPKFLEYIQTLNPDVVIICGGPTLKAFGVKDTLSTTHGRALSVPVEGMEGRTVIPMHNPSAAMSNADLVDVMITDWKNLPREIEDARGVQTQTANYRLATNEEAGEYIRGHGVFAFDLETTEPFVQKHFTPSIARILGYSVAVREGEALYIPEVPSGYVVEALGNPDIWTVCHNAKFEYEVLAKAGILLHEASIEDTQLQAYSLGYHTTALKDLTGYVLGVKQTRLEDVKKGRPTEEISPEEWCDYGAADSDLTLRLYNIFTKELEDA